MTDRLDAIKAAMNSSKGLLGRWADNDIDWLVAEVERLRHDNTFIEAMREDVREARGQLTALRHDIDAYRGSLGYSIPGVHDGRLSDGTLPQNGLANALLQRHASHGSCHDLVCSGSREHPRGEAGRCCSCKGRDTAYAELIELRRVLASEVRRMRERLDIAVSLVNKQAEDACLWFVARHATEAYLQAALRDLHRAIEAAPEEKQ